MCPTSVWKVVDDGTSLTEIGKISMIVWVCTRAPPDKVAPDDSPL